MKTIVRTSFCCTLVALILFSATIGTAAPGDLDTTFGSGGIVVTSHINPPYFDSPSSMQLQPDGKIVVCGFIMFEDDANNVHTVSFFLARYHPNGTLDTSFGTNGKVIAPINSGAENVGEEIAIQPDGKIIAVGGRHISDGVTGFAVNRYNSDGTLDASFGTGGRVVTQVSNYSRGAKSVKVQPDGKMVVVGDAEGFAVVRYNPNGSLDTSFGAGGKVITQFYSGSHHANAVMLQPNGKIIVAGHYETHPAEDFALARYNADGSLDFGFGVDGKVVQMFPNSSGYLLDAELQPDGRILVGGIVEPEPGSPAGVKVVVCYKSDGSTDTIFAANDIFTAPNNFISAFDSAEIALQPNGKIVLFGSLNSGASTLRINPNGSLDTNFGSNGIATTNYSFSYGRTGAIQQDGRILLLGFRWISNNNIIACFLSDSAIQQPAQFDFDGDARSDISVFRSSNRTWYLNQSTVGFSATQFGLSTDKITPADFDGDGKTDIAVFRDGVWYWINSSNNQFNVVKFGLANDIAVPADFTGDGRAELAVYRGGVWWSLNLSNNQTNAIQFGNSTDKPVVADYDGDGRADQAVYRNGEWHLNRSTQGYTVIQFGISTDKTVQADYDGDGRADQAVYRDGVWYVLRSSQGFTAFQFGVSTDIPTPADYDGDGKTDAAVYRNGVWYLLQSTKRISIQQFGLTNDKPVPAAFLP